MSTIRLAAPNSSDAGTFGRVVLVDGSGGAARIVAGIQEALQYNYQEDLFDAAALELAGGDTDGAAVAELQDNLAISITVL